MLQRLFPYFFPSSDVPDREAAGDPGKFFRLRRLFSAGFRTRNRNVSKREAILDDFRRIRIQYRKNFEGWISGPDQSRGAGPFQEGETGWRNGIGKGLRAAAGTCIDRPFLASGLRSLRRPPFPKLSGRIRLLPLPRSLPPSGPEFSGGAFTRPGSP